ncbi:transglycosylase domain-containing protein [Sorangium sp. So ce128]
MAGATDAITPRHLGSPPRPSRIRGATCGPDLALEYSGERGASSERGGARSPIGSAAYQHDHPAGREERAAHAQRTLDRKMRELLLARPIEQELTKDQILELYLNHIYFGHGKTQ